MQLTQYFFVDQDLHKAQNKKYVKLVVSISSVLDPCGSVLLHPPKNEGQYLKKMKDNTFSLGKGYCLVQCIQCSIVCLITGESLMLASEKCNGL